MRELAADEPLVAAFSLAATVTALTGDYPLYEIWTEQLRTRGPVRFAAQRKPGARCQPFAVVTPDEAELRAALGARRAASGSPRPIPRVAS
jgi:hypothetical protein